MKVVPSLILPPITVSEVGIRVCYGLKPVARYETCPTLVVWAIDEGFIDQIGSLSYQASLLR